jgi:hypothetical protein
MRPSPDWLPAHMPPGYRNRLEEIQRLTRDLDEMGRFGRLLYAVGSDLDEAVRETFEAFGFEASVSTTGGAPLVVKLDDRRRLLVHVSKSETPIQRRGGDLATVFQMLHEIAEGSDRVVLMANTDPGVPPSDRPDGMEAEAVAFLKRLSANFMSSRTLFSVWSTSLSDRSRARALVESLHAQDGGVFAV